MQEFKVGQRVKKKESMWAGLSKIGYIENAPSLTISAVISGEYPALMFEEVVNFSFDAAYFELAVDEQKVKRFAQGDKVISTKNTPEVPEGFVGFILDNDQKNYDYAVRKEWTVNQVEYFNEGELELLSAGISSMKIPLSPSYEKSKEELTVTPQDINGIVDKEEHTGGSVGYYKVLVSNPTTLDKPYYAEANDIIESLGLTFAEGNLLKAVWRIAADRNGKKKKGNNSVYDAEKLVFFAERVLAQEKAK